MKYLIFLLLFISCKQEYTDKYGHQYEITSTCIYGHSYTRFQPTIIGKTIILIPIQDFFCDSAVYDTVLIK